MTRIYVI